MVILVCLLLSLLVPCANAAQYDLVALETPADKDSNADAINCKGEVVGRANYRAALWRNGKLIDLGTFGQKSSLAPAINDQGQIVVEAYSVPSCCNPSHVFVGEEGNLTDVGQFKNYPIRATSVNNRGQVVGYSDDGRGFMWTSLKGMQDLGGPQYGHTMPRAINNKGLVVGESSSSAVIWQDGKMTDLGKLEGVEGSRARSINDKGQVVGSSHNTGYSGKKRITLACLWDKGKITDLGTLGGNWSDAFGINNKGQVVGVSGTSGEEIGRNVAHAFIWESGKMTDLNTLIPSDSGWVLRHASAINDAGQIVGDGDFQGHTRAFLLTPRPQEPPKPASPKP